MNKHLITQVQAGTHCIEHTRKPEDKEKLVQVVYKCWPNQAKPLGTSLYYFNHPDRKGEWTDYIGTITGLTPIPLDDFFKEETCSCSDHDTAWCSCEKDNQCVYCKKPLTIEQDKPATPEQPIEQVVNYFDNKDPNETFTAQQIVDFLANYLPRRNSSTPEQPTLPEGAEQLLFEALSEIVDADNSILLPSHYNKAKAALKAYNLATSKSINNGK